MGLKPFFGDQYEVAAKHRKSQKKFGMPDFEVPTPYRGGLTFGFGFRVSQISLNLDFYHQFGKLFDTSAGLPDAHGSNFTATLGWWF